MGQPSSAGEASGTHQIFLMGKAWLQQEGSICRWVSSIECPCGRSSASVQRGECHLSVNVDAAQQAGPQMAGSVEHPGSPPAATAAGAMLEGMLVQEAAQVPALLAGLVTTRAAASSDSSQVCLQCLWASPTGAGACIVKVQTPPGQGSTSTTQPDLSIPLEGAACQ